MVTQNPITKYASVYGDTFMSSFRDMGVFLVRSIPWLHWAYWSIVLIVISGIITLFIIFFIWSKFLR